MRLGIRVVLDGFGVQVLFLVVRAYAFLWVEGEREGENSRRVFLFVARRDFLE